MATVVSCMPHEGKAMHQRSNGKGDKRKGKRVKKVERSENGDGKGGGVIKLNSVFIR